MVHVDLAMQGAPKRFRLIFPRSLKIRFSEILALFCRTSGKYEDPNCNSNYKHPIITQTILSTYPQYIMLIIRLGIYLALQ